MQESITSVKSKITTLGLAIFLGLTTLFLSFPPEFAFAQNQQPQTQATGGGFVPCGNTADNPCNVSHLFALFVIIVNYLIAMAGFVAVVAIIYAGLLMVSSQGEDRLVQGKKRLFGAVFGLILVAVAFILINSVFSGSFNLGIKDGAQILTNPKAYINQ